MEELIMKVAPRAYNRKKMFQSRTKADKNKEFVTVKPEDKYFYTKEGSFMDWRYCKMAPRERTSKRESQELKRYRNICTKSVSKRERRVYDHMFREALRDHEVMEYLDHIRAYGGAEEAFVDEMLTSVQNIEEENNFRRLPNGICVYEPPVSEVLNLFDFVLDRYIKERDLYYDEYLRDDEDFLFDMEALRVSIETGTLSYSDIVHTGCYHFGKVSHEDNIILRLRYQLMKKNFVS